MPSPWIKQRTWTDSDLMLLTQYASEGYSAGEIAQMMGFTRCAVSSKADRHQIKLGNGNGTLKPVRKAEAVQDAPAAERAILACWGEERDELGRVVTASKAAMKKRAARNRKSKRRRVSWEHHEPRVTAEEQALIEAALEAGKVTVCTPGVACNAGCMTRFGEGKAA